MKARFFLFLAAAAAAIVVLASCTANGGSIYATIEVAKKTVTSSLAKTLTIQDMAAQAPGGPYFIAAGAIYKGTYNPGAPSTTGDVILWNTDGSANLIPTPPPVPGQICSSLVFRSGRLWGAFFNPANQSFGLYQSDASLSFAASTADPYFAGKQIMLLQVTSDGVLFAVAGAVTGNPYQFELHYFDGANWHQLLSGLTPMINGVARVVVATLTQYWAVSGTTIYAFNAAFAQIAPPSVDLSAASQLNGIFVDTTNANVFLPSKSGGVYYSWNSGSGWIRFPPDTISSNTVGYLCVAGPVDPPTNDKYVVGADGGGYSTISIGGQTMTRFNDATILLYSAAVRRILVDSVPIVSVFMGTAGGGLWRATFNNGVVDPSTVGWIHE
jgi:hypothetical protein